MEAGKPTYIWAVCVLTGRRQIDVSFETVRARFTAQTNIKNARIVFVTAKGYLKNAEQTDATRLIMFDRPQTKIGELRNLAKTYVANEIIRDRGAHLICHWDESDIYYDDYLAYLSQEATTDKLSMLQSAIYYDATTGYTCAKKVKTGVISTLAYSPFANFAFAPVIRNEFLHVQQQLQDSPKLAKQRHKLELALHDLPPTQLLRRYDGLNSESRSEFLAPPLRDLVPEEIDFVREQLRLDRERTAQFY